MKESIRYFPDQIFYIAVSINQELRNDTYQTSHSFINSICEVLDVCNSKINSPILLLEFISFTKYFCAGFINDCETLREKCSSTKFFLVRIFLYSD